VTHRRSGERLFDEPSRLKGNPPRDGAALFLRGILVSLRWQPGTSIHLADLRTRLDRTTITRLRGLCTPRLAAALTIALITGLPPPALAALNTVDITPDGSAVNRAGEWFAVPAHAQALIRALLIERARDNANPQAPPVCRPRRQSHQ